MGASMARTLGRVLPDSGEGSPWLKNARGPTLRRLFGAYLHTDLWTVYRRLKVVDPAGSDYLNYEELQQLLSLPDFNLMYLWDLFSQQNELVHGRELLATICVFSSATLVEKARFLTTVFDSSHTGMCTGAELAQMCVSTLGVLARCTGTVVKPKEVTSALREELPRILPEYGEAMKRKSAGRESVEQSFRSERLIGQAEIDKLVPTFQPAYQELPVAGPPPNGAIPPPPPEWNEHAAVPAASGYPGDTSRGLLDLGLQTPAAGTGTFAARALGAGRQGDGLSWGLTPMLTEAQVMKLTTEQEQADAEIARISAAREEELTRRAEEAAKAKVFLPPATGNIVIHGVGFADVEKDLAGFRYCFCKGISGALGIPSGCVEIVDVGQGDTLVVEFTLHPSGRGGDFRDGLQLLASVEEQLASASSPLRRGYFRGYAASAEFRPRGAVLPTWPSSPAAHGDAASRDLGERPRRKVRIEVSTQATNVALTIEEVLRLVDEERLRYEAAEARLTAFRRQILDRDAVVADLRREEEDLRRMRQRGIVPPRAAAVEAKLEEDKKDAAHKEGTPKPMLQEEAEPQEQPVCTSDFAVMAQPAGEGKREECFVGDGLAAVTEVLPTVATTSRNEADLPRTGTRDRPHLFFNPSLVTFPMFPRLQFL